MRLSVKQEDVKKVAIGVTVFPETFQIFKAGAKLFKVNLSQFLSMVIHRRDEEGFVYSDVGPKYGEVSDSTKQTLLYVSEEQRALLQGWADRENCSLTSIVRCLMDITVNKMLAYDREVRDSSGQIKEDSQNAVKVEIFDNLEKMGVDISGIVDEGLKEFKDVSVRKALQGYTPSSRSIFDYKVTLTDKQLAKLESTANRQKADLESVKHAFELTLLVHLVEQKPRFCHVSKEQFLELKHICQNIGATPSKLLNDYSYLLREAKYHAPELAKDVELLRVNVTLETKTTLVLERFCAERGIKMAEAVRLLMSYIYNYFQQEGIKIPANYVF
jgi:antitoxin component of RelBE/YafQ-DinJ toxin-antitoxin module